MDLFSISFISVRLVDIIDIIATTFILYKLFEVLRGTLTLRIFSVLLAIFFMWKVVDLLELRLLKSILNQFFGAGALALVILFAPEIRKFLSAISKNTILDRILRQVYTRTEDSSINRDIVESLKDLRATGNGALIVVLGNNPLKEIQDTGERLNANITSRLIFSIFQKESPLHDGAMLINTRKILAVRCILPISESQQLSPELGMRHRSAVGVSELSDALVIVVSEERREISLSYHGELRRNVDYVEVEEAIISHIQKTII